MRPAKVSRAFGRTVTVLSLAALVGITFSCTQVGERGESSADAGPAIGETQATAGAASPPPVPLEESGPVVVPDTTEGTAWLGQVTKLLADPGNATFFALQANQGDAVEFTADGHFVARFGGQRGQGPGEISKLVDLAVSDTAVALLDQGNRRVAVFERSGSLHSEFPASPTHRALAWLGESLVLLPGQDGAALDLLSLASGKFTESLGGWEALPVRCSAGESDCRREAAACRGCEVVTTRNRIVLFNKDQAIITALTRDGEIAWRRDYQRDDPLLSSWVEADEPVRERMEREAAARARSGVARTEVIKSYFLDVEGSGDDHLTVAVVPSADEFRRRGYEVWVIDARDGTYRRYGYPRPGVGYLVAGQPKKGLLALEPGTGGVFSFRSGLQVVDSIQLEESGSVINVHPVVQVDPDGGFLVADVSEAQVRRYSEHGELLWHLGRRGRGPNEFQSTRAAARLPDGRVLVADLPDRLVLINAAGTETIKSLGIHLSRPEDLEVSDDSTVIVGGILGSPFGPGQTPASYLAGPRLHLIDVDDEVVTRSFFRPFEGYNIDVAAMAGSVVFSERGGLIAAAALPKDTVYFFAKSGVALGQVPLPSAHFRVIEPLNPDDFQDPRKRQAWLESFDSVTGIEWLNADTLVVEYRSLVGTEMRWSLVVMTRAGERVLEWRNSPRLFTVTEAGLLVLQAPNSLTPDKWIVVRLPS